MARAGSANFYEGSKLPLSLTTYTYTVAFRGTCNISTPLQSEEFIIEIIEREPKRTDLFLCLGVINFFAKEDYAAAVRDLEVFLAETDLPPDSAVRLRAESILAEAHNKLATP